MTLNRSLQHPDIQICLVLKDVIALLWMQTLLELLFKPSYVKTPVTYTFLKDSVPDLFPLDILYYIIKQMLLSPLPDYLF